MLLDLPPELIQLILKHCTCASYIQAAFSCFTLLDIASSSREVILHHLHRIPGGNSGLGVLKTKELFRLLLRRSAQQLFWAQFSATCKVFNFESDDINARASSLGPGGSNLALVLRGQPTVYRFHAGDGKLSFAGQLNPPCEQEGAVEVLKTAIDKNGGAYVLQRFTPAIAKEDLEAKHPFVIHALHSRPHGIIYLAHYKPYSSGQRVRTCAFPDHDGYEPLAFAVGNEDTFVIAWHRSSEDELEVVLYTELLESTENETGTIGSFYIYFLFDSSFHFFVIFSYHTNILQCLCTTHVLSDTNTECTQMAILLSTKGRATLLMINNPWQTWLSIIVAASCFTSIGDRLYTNRFRRSIHRVL